MDVRFLQHSPADLNFLLSSLYILYLLNYFIYLLQMLGCMIRSAERFYIPRLASDTYFVSDLAGTQNIFAYEINVLKWWLSQARQQNPSFPLSLKTWQ